VPFIEAWIVQWNAYVPALLNTRLCLPPPPAIAAPIVQEPSSSPTLWDAVSVFVHVMTSPTLALIGCDHWKFATVASTVVVPVESVQTAAAWVAPPPPPGAWVAAPPPPEQAASAAAVASVAAPRTRDRIIGVLLTCAVRATIARRLVHSSYGSPVVVDRISEAELAHRLVLHEARAQATPARELRDLGDGWLVHDRSDAEPFWNRLIAPRWPTDAVDFDRRLDAVITLFATLDRLPHVRPLPVGGTPGDLGARLEAAGFEAIGMDRRMVLHRDADQIAVAALVRRLTAEVEGAFNGAEVTVRRRDGATSTRRDGSDPQHQVWADRRRWAVDASLVLADSFGVDADRRIALESDLLGCISRPGCGVLLVSVDGVPAAIARRATTPDGTYLSSIGTRPAFRGRGLGALVTALAVQDAVAGGGPLIHLGVEIDNTRAIRLYERLGFAVLGEPAPDLLLLR
jgi:ribosomal protein S18 acetylase RimI-like enzyme